MWTFPFVFKLSESAICAVGAFDLYCHTIYLKLHTPPQPARVADSDVLCGSKWPPPFTASRDRTCSAEGSANTLLQWNRAERKQRQRSKINLPIITKAFNTQFQRELAPNQGSNLFALTTVSIFSNLIGNFTACLHHSGSRGKLSHKPGLYKRNAKQTHSSNSFLSELLQLESKFDLDF